MEDFIVELQAKLDEAASKGLINEDIDNKLQGKLNILKLQAQIDPESAQAMAKQLSDIINQKITLSNINIDTGQTDKIGEQIGENIGKRVSNSLSRSIQSSLLENKAAIKHVMSDLDKNALGGLVSKFNLTNKSIDPQISKDVNNLTKELNALAKEAVKTDTDSAWENLISKSEKLRSILQSYGQVRVDMSQFDGLKQITDYFKGMTINIPSQNIKEVLSSLNLNGLEILPKKGSIENLKNLNTQLKDLGITFAEGKSNLNGDWESIFSGLGRYDLASETNNIDQYIKLINELLVARDKMNGFGSLQPAKDEAGNVINTWMDNIDNSAKRMRNLNQEQIQLQEQLSLASTADASNVIQNEQKKQEAYERTAQVQRQIAANESIVKSGANSLMFDATNNAAKEAAEHFRELLVNENAVITVSEKFNESNDLNAFTVNIKRASGEVESLHYALRNIGTVQDSLYVFKNIGAGLNDAGAIKQIEQIEKTSTEYSNKLNDLKAKLTGTNFDYSGFEKMITDFRNGEVTVNQLSTAFNQLKNSAETSLKGLNSQNSSFNTIQQAQNNMRDLPNMITALETNMNSLKDKTSLNVTSVQDLASAYNSLKAEMDAAGGTIPLTDEWINKYQNLMSTVTGLTKQVETLKKVEASDNSSVKLAAQANKIQLNLETGGYESKVETLIAKTKQWTDTNGNARISTDTLSTALDKLTTASNAFANNNTVENQQALIKAESELDIEVKKVTNSVRTMNATLAKDSAVSSLHNQIQKFYNDNGAAHKKWGAQLKQILSETASGAEVTKERITEIRTAFNGVASAAQQAGKMGKTWFQSLKDATKFLTYWTSPTFITMKAIAEVKQGISSIKQLDTALVDLKKTTTMTASQLEDFYYDSNDVAKQMGVTTEEITNQAAAWSRLGYSSAEAATQMAKYSSMFATISPGMDLDSATNGLVSVMKAFDIGNQNAEDVVDGIMSKINIIGNTRALNNSDIIEFLRRSSSAMAEANNSLEDSIALGTAIVEITRDAAGAGQVLKTVSMRIRGKQTLPPYKEIYMLCA